MRRRAQRLQGVGIARQGAFERRFEFQGLASQTRANPAFQLGLDRRPLERRPKRKRLRGKRVADRREAGKFLRRARAIGENPPQAGDVAAQRIGKFRVARRRRHGESGQPEIELAIEIRGRKGVDCFGQEQRHAVETRRVDLFRHRRPDAFASRGDDASGPRRRP